MKNSTLPATWRFVALWALLGLVLGIYIYLETLPVTCASLEGIVVEIGARPVLVNPPGKPPLMLMEPIKGCLVEGLT